ncbi:hypothetical protein PanWU01x14_184010 [Parasponia andersonii]|uniref:Uncharacterized protein n=1 Tax=Parasponia andersonii TaxID=3476 RepID=A0A2P5C4P4_PARAD|nr:hypothetical protein PanWU01x14_184010 [Parasponia andersonii]
MAKELGFFGTLASSSSKVSSYYSSFFLGVRGCLVETTIHALFLCPEANEVLKWVGFCVSIKDCVSTRLTKVRSFVIVKGSVVVAFSGRFPGCLSATNAELIALLEDLFIFRKPNCGSCPYILRIYGAGIR